MKVIRAISSRAMNMMAATIKGHQAPAAKAMGSGPMKMIPPVPTLPPAAMRGRRRKIEMPAAINERPAANINVGSLLEAFSPILGATGLAR